jgi:uncharacterized protein (TIGR02391 family)
MNLETKLEPRLWDAVRTSIEGRRFSNAVLDAVHFLSDVIRERSGLEGDGVGLIGAAFGGASPKLKVNRLQTESEQNVQKGIESLLRGVYQAIRNPRSHGMHVDEERDAVAIILFLDYLLRIVDQSRSPSPYRSLSDVSSILTSSRRSDMLNSWSGRYLRKDALPPAEKFSRDALARMQANCGSSSDVSSM